MAVCWTIRRHAWVGLAVTLVAAVAVPAFATSPPDGVAPLGTLAHGAADPFTQSPAADPVVDPPMGFDDVDAWLRYRAFLRAPALPMEARVLYRRGLVARRSSTPDEALVFVRGAAELDPTFLRARWTLLCWQLFSDPTQVGVEATAIFKLLREDFVTQWSLASNATALLAQAFVLALLFMGLLVVFTHQDELRHAAYERLRRWASHPTSTILAWVLFLAPYVLLGPTLATVVCLAVLWPLLVLRERIATVALTVALLTVPFASWWFDRLSVPMRTSEEPIAALIPLETEPRSESLRANLESVARRHGEDPYVQFGIGWVAQHAGDWPSAEDAYRRVLSRWADDGRTLDNLGSVLVHEGRREEAVKSYEHAALSEPRNAVAQFNLAQAYLQNYEFEAASRAMARASALDFDRVREYKNQPARGGGLMPVPDWMGARRQWAALFESRPFAAHHLPPTWRSRPEINTRFALVVVVAAILGVVIGGAMQRALPLHHCGNCRRVVCRRCAERRRSQTLCRACGRVARGAASVDFARILLARQRQRSTRVLNVVGAVLSWAVPGAGLVAFRRLGRPWMLLFGLALVVTAVSVQPWPYAGRPRVGWEGAAFPWGLAAVMAVLYAVSFVWTTNEHRRERARVAAADQSFRMKRKRGEPTDDRPQRVEAA